MEINYWNKDVETASREDIQAIQLSRLREVVDFALKTDHYKRLLPKAGINSSSDIQTLDDLKKIPFTMKDDLRQNYPTGLLALEFKDVVRMHSSSGTTGIPTVIYLSKDDLDSWTNLVARSIVATGGSSDDIFQNMMSYGLFTGGLGLHYGAERVGMMVIPIGGGNTGKQIQMMKDFQTTSLHITPSYLLHIHSKLAQSGVSLEELNLKRAFIGAEPHSEETRQKLEELFGIKCFNSYGLSEMNGPGVAFECEYRDGMHIWEDGFIPEIIDPETGEVLPDGELGELVLTNLTRKAMPILRYRTRDLAYLYDGVCRCGRQHRRLSRIKGRTDDMMIINGVNVFPSQIEEVIMRIPEVGTNYQIYLTKKGAIDQLTVKVELYSKIFSGEASQLDQIKKRIKEELRASIFIHPQVQLHEPGYLPVFEGKAIRVVDQRDQM